MKKKNDIFLGMLFEQSFFGQLIKQQDI